MIRVTVTEPFQGWQVNKGVLLWGWRVDNNDKLDNNNKSDNNDEFDDIRSVRFEVNHMV